MARRSEDRSSLSMHRAFVVHFGTYGGPKRRRFHGRVEHLPSGRTARFSSLKGLLDFVAGVLDGSEAGGLPFPIERKKVGRGRGGLAMD